MDNDSYFDDFLDSNDLPSKDVPKVALPSWVSHANSSYAAYQAILSLEAEKKLFIKKHNLKSKYKKKSNFKVQKSEVGRIVGKNPQPLFNSNSYSKDLSDLFKNTNDDLEILKEARINSSSSGVGNKRKEDLVIEHKALIKTHQHSITQTVDALYQKLIDNMPLDVKRKLRIG